MNTQDLAYISPKMEIVEMEIEQAVLTGSQHMNPQEGNWI